MSAKQPLSLRFRKEWPLIAQWVGGKRGYLSLEERGYPLNQKIILSAAEARQLRDMLNTVLDGGSEFELVGVMGGPIPPTPKSLIHRGKWKPRSTDERLEPTRTERTD